MFKTCQRGGSMIEMISVIAIIAVISVGAMKLIATLYDKYKVSRVVDEVRQLQKNVSSRFAATGDYATLDQKNLIAEKVIPAVLVVGDKILHSQGGEVMVNPDEDDLFYVITFSGLNRKACVELGNIGWMINQSSDLEILNINGFEMGWPCTKTDQSRCASEAIKKDAPNALPAQASVIAIKCIDGSSNVIKWVFQ